MGRQIAINLSSKDEDRLIDYLQSWYPIKIVNHLYEQNWDRTTLKTTNDANKWLIIDTRIEDLIKVDCSNQIDLIKSKNHNKWQIRSWNRSCIEWDRKNVTKDRLWINTHQNTPFGKNIPEEFRKDNLKYFNAACYWIKKNCKNTSTGRFSYWESGNK